MSDSSLFTAHALLVDAKWDRKVLGPACLPPSSVLAVSCLARFPSTFRTTRQSRATTAMEDAASEISDWEVLSASSACGGDDRDDEVVVSGGGGDVLPDHFTLGLASPDAGFSGEVSWLEPELQETVVDDTREGSVREAVAACGGNCSAERRQDEETEQENNGERSCSELDLALHPAHHGVGEHLDSDTTTATDASPQSEVSESSSVQLEDIGAVASIKSSGAEDFVTNDGVHGEQAEQNQGNDAYAGTGKGCTEADGEAKDGALPLVQVPGTGEEGKQVVVWWRLPFKLLHYCAWNIKPVWSFSIAAALLGLVMLGRKIYRMKHKAKGLPQIKIAFDDKRTSQYANRAARLNEAFLIARRVPMLRTSSGAALPWSMVQER